MQKNSKLGILSMIAKVICKYGYFIVITHGWAKPFGQRETVILSWGHWLMIQRKLRRCHDLERNQEIYLQKFAIGTTDLRVGCFCQNNCLQQAKHKPVTFWQEQALIKLASSPSLWLYQVCDHPQNHDHHSCRESILLITGAGTELERPQPWIIDPLCTNIGTPRHLQEISKEKHEYSGIF